MHPTNDLDNVFRFPLKMSRQAAPSESITPKGTAKALSPVRVLRRHKINFVKKAVDVPLG